MARGSLDGWNKKRFGFGLDKWGQFRLLATFIVQANLYNSNRDLAVHDPRIGYIVVQSHCKERSEGEVLVQ